MEDSMRAHQIGLFLGLCLLLLVCGGCKQGQGQAPPPLDKDMLIGKWEADDPEQFIQTFEFAADHSLKMTIRTLPDVVPGKFEWTGETKLTVEYQPSEEMQKKCRAFLADFKAKTRERGEKTPGPTGAAITRSADLYPDEVPTKDVYQVGLSDRHGPVLIVSTEKELRQRFKRPKSDGK
jgi:hypothetical protein